MQDMPTNSDHHAVRQRWMSVLARASADTIAVRLREWGEIPDYTLIRGPEGGLAMVRGRAGGGGAPFNLGEMTVTRCTVRTVDGLIGHAYVRGRDSRHATLAALVDALMQQPQHTESLERAVVAPLEAAEQERRDAIAAKAEATKVRFFTLQTTRS